jgi:hypothetical protein
MNYPIRSAGLFLLIALQACAPGAAAEDFFGKQQCAPEIVALVGKHAGVKDLCFPRKGLEPSVDNGGLVVAGVCKAWPGNPSRIIAALAYDAGIEHEKQLLVALIDAPRSTVIAAYSGYTTDFASLRVTARRFDGNRPKRHDRPRSLEVDYDGQGYPRPRFEDLR